MFAFFKGHLAFGLSMFYYENPSFKDIKRYQHITGRAELLQPSNLSPCVWQLHHPPGKTPPEFGPEDPEFRWAA